MKPEYHLRIDPLVAEYDYGDYEGMTSEQIHEEAPGWDIWRDGCPRGESSAEVGARADTFLRTTVEPTYGFLATSVGPRTKSPIDVGHNPQ